LVACALLSAVMARRVPADRGWDIWPLIGGAIATYCFLGLFPRKVTLKTLFAHGASAAVAGAAGGFLLSWLPRLLSLHVSSDGQVDAWRIEVATPPIVVSVVGAVLLYRFLMGTWISKKVRELCGWLCRSLIYISAVWLLVALIWNLDVNSVSV